LVDLGEGLLQGEWGEPPIHPSPPQSRRTVLLGPGPPLPLLRWRIGHVKKEKAMVVQSPAATSTGVSEREEKGEGRGKGRGAATGSRHDPKFPI
jgi:hypothetical protein